MRAWPSASAVAAMSNGTARPTRRISCRLKKSAGGEVFYFRRNPALQPVGFEERDNPDAARAFTQGRAVRVDPDAVRRHRAHAGHHHAPRYRIGSRQFHLGSSSW